MASERAAMRAYVLAGDAAAAAALAPGTVLVSVTHSLLSLQVLGLRLDFHWLVTMSGYTYPLQSNADIRARLAAYPADTNFLVTPTALPPPLPY